MTVGRVARPAPPCAQDATFEFEKRRNVPVKYDRDLVGTTIRAMKRVQEIQQLRDKRFYEKRMREAHKTEHERLQDRLDIAQNMKLIPPAERVEILTNLAAKKAAALAEAVEDPVVATAAADDDGAAAPAPAAAGGGGRRGGRRTKASSSASSELD